MLLFHEIATQSTAARKALLRGPVKPTVSLRGLTTGSIKTIKNTNNFSIFNWIPQSSRGMTIRKPVHTTMPARNDDYPPNKHHNPSSLNQYISFKFYKSLNRN
ncbi:hypothetical protein [Rickettsia tamurae]|uniref:hypothetical protein n=1 Tax=Rickettsia tamurae TaxID=334545 RepID=UPI000B1FD9D8|nr:hypothetical protein [Rickettsia tamurae]